MGTNTRLMSLVFDIDDPLYTREYASDIIKYRTFSTIQTNVSIWTPATGKSIYLTAMEVSTSAPTTITLARNTNTAFMSIVLTSSLATYSESFPSPIKFNIDEIIHLSTNAATNVNITLFGYEL